MIKLLLMNMVSIISIIRFYSSYVSWMDQIITFLFIYIYIYIYIYIILGLIRQPKWGHLKELHAAIKVCSATLVQGERTNFSLGQHQEVMSQIFIYVISFMVSFIYLFCFYLGLCFPRRGWRVCGHSYKL
jgi:hypothetical protein